MVSHRILVTPLSEQFTRHSNTDINSCAQIKLDSKILQKKNTRMHEFMKKSEFDFTLYIFCVPISTPWQQLCFKHFIIVAMED